jgi:hypothetical protein
MRVEKATDRMTQPTECDGCATEGVPLQRYSSYGPGHQVSWLCCYCCNDFSGGNDIVRSIAAMLHVQDKRNQRK